MVTPAKPIASYELAPEFERTVAVLMCTRPKFFGVVGYDIEFARITDAVARLAIAGAQLHAKEAGRAPSDGVVVVQRLQSQRVEGKITHEQVMAVVDMIEEAFDRLQTLDQEDVLAELVPAMRRIMEHEATLAAIEDSHKGKGMARPEQMIQRAKQLGVQDRSKGTRLGVGVFKALARLRSADRLSTGILELDTQLNGGLSRSQLCMFIAAAKAGKSSWLVSQSVSAIKGGQFVAYATLENSEEMSQTRVVSNLTGIPSESIIDGSRAREAEAALEALLPTLGRFDAKFFPATVTTMTDIIAWLTELEQEAGKSVDLFVVDYIDKVRGKGKSEYEVQNNSTEEMRLYVEGRQLWGHTASQVKRLAKEARNKRVEGDDAADSMGKVRVPDLVITAHRPSEYEIEFYVAGSRTGRDRFGVGPYAHGLECSRIVAALL